MGRLADDTVAMFFGGDYDPEIDTVIKPGNWPTCMICEAKADLHWRTEKNYCFCFGCVKTVCGGLVVDLMLEGQAEPEEITAELLHRYRRTRRGRVRHEFPTITNAGRTLVQNEDGRAFIAEVYAMPREVRDEVLPRYESVIGVDLLHLHDWLVEVDPEQSFLAGGFGPGDYDHIDHMLGLD